MKKTNRIRVNRGMIECPYIELHKRDLSSSVIPSNPTRTNLSKEEVIFPYLLLVRMSDKMVVVIMVQLHSMEEMVAILVRVAIQD
jgi:hypothetical protein